MSNAEIDIGYYTLRRDSQCLVTVTFDLTGSSLRSFISESAYSKQPSSS